MDNKSLAPVIIDIRALDNTGKAFTDISTKVRKLRKNIGDNMTFDADFRVLSDVPVRKFSSSFAKLGPGMVEISDILDDLDDKIAKSRKAFAGWAMSIMFAGMAIQRTFTGIYKFGTKTFQDISHSVEGMTTQTDMLDGSMAYLGFTIGQALEPLMPVLITIIDWLSAFIEKNESWIGWFIGAGAVIGGFLALFGGGVLAINGFTEALEKIGLVSKTSAETAVAGTNKMISAFSALKMAVGAGLLIYVATQIFGKEGVEPTASDWLKNLGLAAIGGYLVGGLAGAGIGLLVTLAVMVSREAANNVLKDVEKLKGLVDKVWSGKLTTKDAINNLGLIKFEGTTIPDAAVDYQKGQLTQFQNTLPWANNVSQPMIPTITLNVNTLNMDNVRNSEEFLRSIQNVTGAR